MAFLPRRTALLRLSHMRSLTVLLFAILMLLVAAPAGATDSLPDSVVHLRILARDGETFSVEVTNPSDDVARFDAIGLYFLPETNPKQPQQESQRLGIVSAAQVSMADGSFVNAKDDGLDVAPHRSITLKLTTYCIDAKRSGPTALTKYHLANRRMPSALTRALAGAAQTVTNLGYDPEGLRADANRRPRVAAAYDVQRAIWRVREAMPVALIGDTHRVAE
jgi:hypothetical protein